MKTSFATGILFILLGLCASNAQAQSPAAKMTDSTWEVLEVRCNECHREKKKEWVFNRKTVHYLASSINEQVFIKKKMPKGKPKLTEEESQTLQDWLDSLK